MFDLISYFQWPLVALVRFRILFWLKGPILVLLFHTHTLHKHLSQCRRTPLDVDLDTFRGRTLLRIGAAVRADAHNSQLEAIAAVTRKTTMTC